MITTLNGASRKLEDLLQKTAPPAEVRFVEDPDRPGWGWVCWGNIKVKLLQTDLWEAL